MKYALATLAALGLCAGTLPAFAQGFDVRSFFDEPSNPGVASGAPSYLSNLGQSTPVASPFSNTSYPASLTGATTDATSSDAMSSGGAQGDTNRTSYKTGEAPQDPGPQQSNPTGTTNVQLQQTARNCLATRTVDASPVPSGQFTFGFPVVVPAIRSIGSLFGGSYGYLPPTSTSSVDLDITE